MVALFTIFHFIDLQLFYCPMIVLIWTAPEPFKILLLFDSFLIKPLVSLIQFYNSNQKLQIVGALVMIRPNLILRAPSPQKPSFGKSFVLNPSLLDKLL